MPEVRSDAYVVFKRFVEKATVFLLEDGTRDAVITEQKVEVISAVRVCGDMANDVMASFVQNIRNRCADTVLFNQIYVPPNEALDNRTLETNLSVESFAVEIYQLVTQEQSEDVRHRLQQGESCLEEIERFQFFGEHASFAASESRRIFWELVGEQPTLTAAAA